MAKLRSELLAAVRRQKEEKFMNRFLVDLCFWRSRRFQGSKWKWSTPTACLPACLPAISLHSHVSTCIFGPGKFPSTEPQKVSVSTGTGRNYFVLVTPGQRWRVVHCT